MDYAEEQSGEIEALEAIYSEELTSKLIEFNVVFRENVCWKWAYMFFYGECKFKILTIDNGDELCIYLYVVSSLISCMVSTLKQY